MPVFFGRDISTFARFISVWYGEATMLRAPPNVSSSTSSVVVVESDMFNLAAESQDTVPDRLPPHSQQRPDSADQQLCRRSGTNPGYQENRNLPHRRLEL
jgi:hypothetical protein